MNVSTLADAPPVVAPPLQLVVPPPPPQELEAPNEPIPVGEADVPVDTGRRADNPVRRRRGSRRIATALAVVLLIAIGAGGKTLVDHSGWSLDQLPFKVVWLDAEVAESQPASIADRHRQVSHGPDQPDSRIQFVSWNTPAVDDSHSSASRADIARVVESAYAIDDAERLTHVDDNPRFNLAPETEKHDDTPQDETSRPLRDEDYVLPEAVVSETKLKAPETCTAPTNDLGTAIHWIADTQEAADLAKTEDKLVFLIQVSGNFAREEFT
jgi:hypothetical protein